MKNEFTGNTRVRVYFEGGRMHFATKIGLASIPSRLRSKLSSKSVDINGHHFDWVCRYPWAEPILRDNASLSVADAEVEYLNENPEYFYLLNGSARVYSQLNTACIREAVEAGVTLRCMMTNCKDMLTNIVGDAAPIIECGTIVFRYNQPELIRVKGHLSKDFLRQLLQMLEEIYGNDPKHAWVREQLIPELTKMA